MTIYDELVARGLIAQVTDEKEHCFEKGERKCLKKKSKSL